MSQVEVSKKLKPAKKMKPIPEDSQLIPSEPVKKPRASRAKPKPTKAETLKMMLDTSNELKQIILDLRDDYQKIQSVSVSLGLKRISELVSESLNNLQEDQEDIDEQYKQLLELPDSE